MGFDCINSFSFSTTYPLTSQEVVLFLFCRYEAALSMSEGCKGFGKAFWHRVTKRKHINAEDTSTQLKRCLSTKRLIFIGVGKTVGVGIYVLIGLATQSAGKYSQPVAATRPVDTQYSSLMEIKI